jgi:hypothetical protein
VAEHLIADPEIKGLNQAVAYWHHEKMKEKISISNQASFDSIVVEHSTTDCEIKGLNQPDTL